MRTERFAFSLVMLIILGRVSLAVAADPAYYQERDTWEETLRVSREALVAFEETEEIAAQKRRTADATTRDFEPLALELSFGDKPQKIRVRVAWLKRMFVGTERVRGGLSGIFGDWRRSHRQITDQAKSRRLLARTSRTLISATDYEAIPTPPKYDTTPVAPAPVLEPASQDTAGRWQQRKPCGGRKGWLRRTPRAAWSCRFESTRLR